MTQESCYDDAKVETDHQCYFHLNKIDHALEDVLLKYGNGNVEKHILRIFAEYDDSERINELRKVIDKLRARINLGNDPPAIRMILRKILRSKERILDDSLSSPSGTPPSSDDEDSDGEDDVEYLCAVPGSPTRTPHTSDDEEDDSLAQGPYVTSPFLSPQLPYTSILVESEAEDISHREQNIIKVDDANTLVRPTPKPFKKNEKADQVTIQEDKAPKPKSVKNIKADEATNSEDKASKIKKKIKVENAKLLVVKTPKPPKKIKKAKQVTFMEDKARKPFYKKI